MRQGYAWHTHRVSLLDGESQLRLGPEHVGDATTGMWPSTCVYCLRTARLGQQLRTTVCHHCLSQRGSLAGVLTFLAVAHHEQSESTRDRQGDAGTLEPHVYTANRATRNSFLRHSLLGDLHVARCGSRAELPPKPLFFIPSVPVLLQLKRQVVQLRDRSGSASSALSVDDSELLNPQGRAGVLERLAEFNGQAGHVGFERPTRLAALIHTEPTSATPSERMEQSCRFSRAHS